MKKYVVFFRNLLRSPLQYQAETLIGIIFFVLLVLTHSKTGRHLLPFSYESEKLMSYFVLQYVLTFCVNRCTQNSRWRWLYWLSGFVWVLLLWGDISPVPCVAMASILLALQPSKADNRCFGRNLLNTIIWTTLPIAIGLLLYGLVAAIFATVNSLFRLDLGEQFYYYAFIFIFTMIVPLLSADNVGRRYKDDLSSNPLIHIVIDWILSPALVVYTLILYVYAATIVVRWELPNGGVGWMTSIFLTLSLLCYAVQGALGKRHFDWYYRILPLISVIPLVLLWVGAAHRVSEYGLTEARVYLLALALWTTASMVLLIIPSTRRHRLTTILAAIILFVITFIPSLTARDISVRQQTARLWELIPYITEDGHFPQSIDYEALRQDTVLCRQMLAANVCISYLKQENAFDSFEMQFGRWNLRAKALMDKDETSEFISEQLSVYLTKRYDVGEYRYLLTIPSYYCYMDKNEMLRVKDKGRLLLEYPIRQEAERMLAVDGKIDPDKLLVLHNDSILVVLKEYEQFGNYQTAQIAVVLSNRP